MCMLDWDIISIEQPKLDVYYVLHWKTIYFFNLPLYGILFFFSSSRRHTRWPRDWSSDVCSSDLVKRLIQAQCGRPSMSSFARKPDQIRDTSRRWVSESLSMYRCVVTIDRWPASNWTSRSEPPA